MPRAVFIGLLGGLVAASLVGGVTALLLVAGGGDEASADPRAARTAAAQPERVRAVASGDMFTTGQDRMPTRILGIDAPDRGECGFAGSRRYLQSLIRDRAVTLLTDGLQPDRDGARRRLRYVTLRPSSESLDVGLWAVALGWARVSLAHDFAGVAVYLEAQAAAQRERRGMWRCG